MRALVFNASCQKMPCDPINEEAIHLTYATLPAADRMILIQAKLIFAGSGFGALGNVRLLFEKHQIVLYGKLPSYFLMQIAQELMRTVIDHRRLINHCAVSYQHERRRELE